MRWAAATPTPARGGAPPPAPAQPPALPPPRGEGDWIQRPLPALPSARPAPDGASTRPPHPLTGGCGAATVPFVWRRRRPAPRPRSAPGPRRRPPPPTTAAPPAAAGRVSSPGPRPPLPRRRRPISAAPPRAAPPLVRAGSGARTGATPAGGGSAPGRPAVPAPLPPRPPRRAPLPPATPSSAATRRCAGSGHPFGAAGAPRPKAQPSFSPGPRRSGSEELSVSFPSLVPAGRAARSSQRALAGRAAPAPSHSPVPERAAWGGGSVAGVAWGDTPVEPPCQGEAAPLPRVAGSGSAPAATSQTSGKPVSIPPPTPFP
ncbi:uncharacterized protein LOC135986957 [Caloenas nicobarica]|uniref:uncharacterized protein LOC135986957 n=1 Tax=Caloenas nicobarica TaxID=187106 RepID=UPI0032B86423